MDKSSTQQINQQNGFSRDQYKTLKNRVTYLQSTRDNSKNILKSGTDTFAPFGKPGKPQQHPTFIENIASYPKRQTITNSCKDWKNAYLKGLEPQSSGDQKNQKSSSGSGHTNMTDNKDQAGPSALKYLGTSKLKPKQGKKINEYEHQVKQTMVRKDGSRKKNFSPSKKVKFSDHNETGLFNSGLPKAEKRVSFQMKEEEQKEAPSKSQDSDDIMFKMPATQSKINVSDEISFRLPSRSSFRKKTSMEDSDEDDSSNIYEKKAKEHLKRTNYKPQGSNMLALEKILQASTVYNNYLKKLSNPRKSIRIPEIDNSLTKSKLPKEFYFKPERIVFHRHKEDLPHEYTYNGYNLICRVSEDRKKFYFQDLKQDQLKNMKGIKCNEIVISENLKMSKNAQYDHFNKRFFLFSNEEQTLYVYSETTKDLLCEIKVKIRVYDPLLYLHHISNRIFLLIVGGYNRVQRQIVQGNKFIQIFQFRRWQIQLKSQLIKLVIGRISPIILTVSQKHENKVLILGGNSIAMLNKDLSLNYEYEKDINQSTNLTGVSLPSRQIIQLFDYQEQAICFNHSIKIMNPFMLHDGIIIPINNTCFLLLPECKHLIQLKIFNKEINIIEGKHYPYIPTMKRIQRKELCLQISQEGLIIYRVTENGQFSIITHQDQKKDKCLIY